MLFMMNGNSSNGQSRAITTTFPAGSYLWQYATGTADNGDSMSGFYYTVPPNQQVSDLVIPKGGYFALLLALAGAAQRWRRYARNRHPAKRRACPTLTYSRKDGPDGDPAFNPYGLADAVKTDYTYPYTVPRVTAGTNLTFLGPRRRLGGKYPHGVGRRREHQLADEPRPANRRPARSPARALATDVFLGYEQMQFVSAGPRSSPPCDSPATTSGPSARKLTRRRSERPFTINNGPVNANKHASTPTTIPSSSLTANPERWIRL